MKLKFLQKTALFWIEWYQRSISFGTTCRFTPSCSEYAKQCFLKYGFLKAGLKTFWRLLRCNPFSKGGKDLP